MHLTSVLLLPEPITLKFSHEENIRQTQCEGQSIKHLARIPQDCQLMSHKDKLRGCHTSKETRETGGPNAMWCLGTEEVHQWKNR